MLLFRYEELPERGETLLAAEERIAFPLLPLPSEDELEQQSPSTTRQLHEAARRGAGAAELCGLLYHAEVGAQDARGSCAGAVRRLRRRARSTRFASATA